MALRRLVGHEVTRPLCARAVLSCTRTHLPGQTLEAGSKLLYAMHSSSSWAFWTGGIGRGLGCPECSTVAIGAEKQGRMWLWVAGDTEERWSRQCASSQWILP